MDDKKTKTARIIIFAVIIVGIVVAMKMILGAVTISANYNKFAECLATKGTTFYGAFWCPHCQQQESWFGMSRDALASAGLYKECSNPDGSQNALCQAQKIAGYPTWVFADGTRIEKEMPLADLAAKTSCPLPTDTSAKK